MTRSILVQNMMGDKYTACAGDQPIISSQFDPFIQRWPTWYKALGSSNNHDFFFLFELITLPCAFYSLEIARKIYKRTITFSFDWPVYNKPISQTFCSRKRCIQNIHGLKNIHVMCSYWVWRQHVVVVWNTIQHPKSNFLTFHKPILVKLFWWFPSDFNLEIYVQQNLYLWCSASQHACLLTQWASVWILSEVEILN